MESEWIFCILKRQRFRDVPKLLNRPPVCYLFAAILNSSLAPMNIALPDALTARLAQGDLPALCRRCNVQRLDLFGSAATGRFEPARSDLDFLVAFEPLAPGAYADAYFGLREGLEKLFGRDIDLVTQASLANPYFREQVETERRNLFALT
jgi:uncharacterized protein